MQKLFFVLIIGLGLCGCENFFSTTIVIDPPPPELRIATSANVSSQDAIFKIFVDRSTQIFEDVDYEDPGLEDATVELFVDDSLIGELENTIVTPGYYFSFSTNYSLELDKRIADMGNKFELVISHPDFPTTRATQVLPNKTPRPTNLEYVKNAGADAYGYATEGMRMTIHDAPNEENFYEISAYTLDSVLNDGIYEYYTNPLYPISADPNSEPGPGNNLFLLDRYIDGESHNILIQFEGYAEESNTVVLLYSSITKDRYLYGASIRNFNNAQDLGPFAEPVAIYSNFENGFGTFGLANSEFIKLNK